jgi:hypothetical protein
MNIERPAATKYVFKARHDRPKNDTDAAKLLFPDISIKSAGCSARP